MKKVIAYGITLVLSQTLAGLFIMKIMMDRLCNKEFIKKYSKITAEAMKELSEEFDV